jgi:hypothetical protein
MKTGWPALNWGYYFRLRSMALTKSFQNCNESGHALTNLERDEMWLADIDNDNMYHIQFMVLGENDTASQKTYIIIAQKY